jgi:Uncharacterized protein conserved in archaea
MTDSKVTVRSCIKGSTDLAIKLIVTPAGFFRTMPKTGGLIDPLLYVVMTSLLGVVLSAVESSVSHGAGVHDLGMLAIWLVTVPLIAAILSFFVAAICFAIWTFTGSSESYETSYRCLAYMQILFPITILLSIVPYLGLLGIAWWLYLMVIATREVHKTPIQPALLVYGIIAALIGLVYYSSVSSEMKSKEHLQEFTKELQKMPDTNGMGNPGNR